MINGNNKCNKKDNLKIEKYNIIRRISLNFFTGLFITISYFYFSDSVGSISTYFINESTNIFQFGFTLLFFTFLSVLAGPFHGLLNGFLGELLYQLAFYETLEIQWCILVAIIGFSAGLYKYKPLKYQEKMKIFYTFLVLFISSIIVSVLIILFESLLNPMVKLEIIALDYGFKFLIQYLISIPLIVPFLILLYDYFLAEEEKHFYNMTLTHHPEYACDHTYYLKFGRTYIYFCSRCSGTLIGAVLTLFFMYFLEKSFNFIISSESAILICIFFPIPCIIDWGTQKLLLRKSTTESRVITGLIIGISLYLISFTGKYYFFALFLVILYFSIVGLLMYIGYQKLMKKLSEENEDLSSEEDILFEE
ncbi:MAG: DUF2085 domain-containing protein [Candidatus Lokiarchaeota archaeon]|nr:DUF2085 domain-containing protein [Candidatus Lokiarchaeota archaeon]